MSKIHKMSLHQLISQSRKDWSAWCSAQYKINAVVELPAGFNSKHKQILGEVVFLKCV